MDVLPSLASMPVGDDVVVNLLLLLVDAGESMGDRCRIHVRDAQGNARGSSLSKASVHFEMDCGKDAASDVSVIGFSVRLEPDFI